MQSVMPSSSCLNQELRYREHSSAAKKYRLEYLKSHCKGSEIYRSSCSTTQNFLRLPTALAHIFEEDFEPPSKKFLATPLYK